MNRKKVEEYSILLKDSAAILQADTELWKQFLHFATQFTHYRFRDQLLIYAQNQQATACATFAQWKKIGRYVRSGEHSIVLLDETGNRPRLRHIFDVTSTGPTQEFAYKPKPILPEEREELAKRLSTSYARENSLYAADAKRWDNNLEQTLSQVAMYMTQEYYGVSLEQAMEQSGKDEFPAYYVATATSAMYLLLSKYGFEQEANQLDFSCMSQLDEQSFDNVGILRDADSLCFERMAPIFDSGKSLFVSEAVPTDKELLKIKTASFTGTELGLLKYVRDRSLVDVVKLPTAQKLWELYHKDSKMDEKRIELICERYEKKVELFQRWQNGQDLNPRKSYNRGIERSARVQNKELQIEEEEELER